MKLKKIATAMLLAMPIFLGCKKEDDPAIVYSKVSITRLTILNFPVSNTTGGDWDSFITGTYPDVYFKITKSGTNTSLFDLNVSSRAEDLQLSNLPYSWFGTGGTSFFALTDLSQQIDVDLFDFDSTSGDEYMGTATFNFSNYTTGGSAYPQSITINNGFVSIKLDVTWQQ